MQLEEYKRCGTCKFLSSRPGKYNLPDTFCRLDGKSRNKDDMKDCIGWKKRKEGKFLI